MSEMKSGKIDKFRDWIGKQKPGDKRALVDAPYELQDKGPFDNDPAGAPMPPWFLIINFLGALYFSYYAWYTSLQDAWLIDQVFVDEILIWATLAISIILLISWISFSIDLHKGIAGAYKYILLIYMWHVGKKGPKRVEWRVNDAWELWNPVTKKGHWRGVSEHEAEQTEDEIRLERDVLLAEVEELEKKRSRAEVDLALDAIKPKLGKRFSSAKELIQAAYTIADSVKEALVKDDVKEVMALRKRFMEVIKCLDLDYYVTLLECEGNIYPLVISDSQLFGGGTKSEYGEFSIHKLSVRSWLPWAARTVRNACLGAALYLTDYKFYKVPDQKLAIGRKKDEEVKFAPIIYITHSDGKSKAVKDQYRHGEKLETPTQNDVLQAEVIYASSVADDLFERNKLLTSHLDRRSKSDKELKREHENTSKGTVDQGIRHMRRTGRAGTGGLLSGLSGMRGFTFGKYVFYSIIVVMSFLGLIAILQMFGALDLGWFQPPNNGTETGDGWVVAAEDILRILLR